MSCSREALSHARSFLFGNSNRAHASVYLKRAADNICSAAADDEIALYVSREGKNEDVDEICEAERGSNRVLFTSTVRRKSQCGHSSLSRFNKAFLEI